MRKPRKQYTPQEKVAILRKHLVDKVSVSDICDLHQIHPTVFYNWLKLFFENGGAAFERASKRITVTKDRQIAALQQKLQRKNEVVAELLEEHVQLKKELGEL